MVLIHSSAQEQIREQQFISPNYYSISSNSKYILDLKAF